MNSVNIINQLEDLGVIFDCKIKSNWKCILKNNQLLEIIFSMTSFLSKNATFKERVYCIKNNISNRVLCLHCNINFVPFIKGKYQLCCSSKCAQSLPSTRQKAIKTNLEKYGFICHTQRIESKNKIKQTNLERYGVEYPNQSKSVREKTIHSNLKKYGVECTFELKEVKDKSRKTKKERYNNENYTNKKKRKETCLEKYDVENPLQNKDIIEKVKTTNLERYGNNCSIAHIQNELNKKRIQSNLEKYGVEFTSQINISKKTLELLNNKEWLINQHHNEKKSCRHIGFKLKVDGETIRKRLKEFEIEIKRYSVSSEEIELYNFLNLHKINFITNTRKVISPLELDIFIPDFNLAIEYCGVYWHSENNRRNNKNKNKKYHQIKYEKCKEIGIQLITLFSDEWKEKESIIKKSILHKIGISNERIYARKCNISIPNKKEKKTFLNKYHIQGNGRGSIDYCLNFNNKIVAVIAFIKQKDEFILNRYATSIHVVGGFSKLLKHFKNNNEWNKIITFADLRWSEGDLYEKNGFKLESILSPDYYYSTNGNNRIHKFNFRKSKLNKILDNYNPDLSEFENCNNNGILRIWDCGKKKYIMHAIK